MMKDMNTTRTERKTNVELIAKAAQLERKARLRRARKTQSAIYGNMTCFI